MNDHRIKEAVRKAKRNIKIAQKLKDNYLESYWRGVLYGIQVRVSNKIVKHAKKAKNSKSPPQTTRTNINIHTFILSIT